MLNDLERAFLGDAVNPSPGFPIFKRKSMIDDVQMAQALLRDSHMTESAS